MKTCYEVNVKAYGNVKHIEDKLKKLVSDLSMPIYILNLRYFCHLQISSLSF